MQGKFCIIELQSFMVYESKMLVECYKQLAASEIGNNSIPSTCSML